MTSALLLLLPSKQRNKRDEACLIFYIWCNIHYVEVGRGGHILRQCQFRGRCNQASKNGHLNWGRREACLLQEPWRNMQGASRSSAHGEDGVSFPVELNIRTPEKLCWNRPKSQLVQLLAHQMSQGACKTTKIPASIHKIPCIWDIQSDYIEWRTASTFA